MTCSIARVFAVLVTLVMSASVFAKPADPRFTWSTAKLEFAKGTKPTRAEIEGTWMQVGTASDGLGSEYFEDGWRAMDDLSDAYRSTYKYDFVQSDAFGNSLFKVRGITIIKSSMHPSEWSTQNTWNNARGVAYRFVDGSESSKTCSAYRECRLTDSKNMLLCADIVDGKLCRQIAGQVYTIDGFVRQP